MLTLHKGSVRAAQSGAYPERGLGEQPSLAAAARTVTGGQKGPVQPWSKSMEQDQHNIII